MKCQEQEERQAKVKLNSKFYHKIKVGIGKVNLVLSSEDVGVSLSSR